MRFLAEAGVRRFLELGPDGVLSGMAHECLAETEPAGKALLAASLRARRPEVATFLDFLARAHVHGIDVDWGSLLDGRQGQGATLPTYAFQRRRYWLAPGAGAADASSLGQSPTEHPLLGAALRLAGDGDGWLFTGRLSLESDPWLEDHALIDALSMPGMGLVELAWAAGAHVGCEVVEELALQAPLVLSEDRAVQLQVTVSEPGSDGLRKLEIYSRAQGDAEAEDGDGEQWILHAAGMLGSGEGASAAPWPPTVDQWPPPGSQELDSEFFYDRLAEAGYRYGSSFQGLRRVFGAGEELFAEVAMEERRVGEAQGFCVHPALGDAALHAAFGALDGERASELGAPYAFAGVRLFGRGADALHVRLARAGEPGLFSVLAVDEQGDPVFSIEALRTKAIDRDQLRAARAAHHDAAKAGIAPTVPSGLVRAPTRRAADAGGSLARRLAGVPESEWDGIVSKLVRDNVAGVLGHASAGGFDPQRAFKDLGFDSLAGVELRNRLEQATGLKLPSTLVFDNPSAATVAEYLRFRVQGAERGVKLARRHSAGHSDEPIAIVGMSCRYPGGASSPEQLWDLLARAGDGRSVSSPRTGDGRSSGCSIPTRAALGRATRGTVGSCTTPGISMPSSSGSARARRWRWTLSSVCCWKARGRRSRMRASTRRACAAARRACSRASSPRSTASTCARPRRSRACA